MENTKKKMSDNDKARLIYTIELAVFSVVFIVLGILFLVDVIGMSDRRRTIFTYITLVGGCLMIADFLWACFSTKHRKKISLFDKALTLPVALFLITFDSYALAVNLLDNVLFKYVIGYDFIYLAVVYIAEAIYHWRKPVPGLMEDEKEAQENPEDDGEEKDETPKE